MLVSFSCYILFNRLPRSYDALYCLYISFQYCDLKKYVVNYSIYYKHEKYCKTRIGGRRIVGKIGFLQIPFAERQMVLLVKDEKEKLERQRNLKKIKS